MLEDYFYETKAMFDVKKEDKNGKKFIVREEKTVVLAKNVAELAIFIQQQRNIKNPLMKIGLDSGQEFMKITLSIQETKVPSQNDDDEGAVGGAAAGSGTSGGADGGAAPDSVKRIIIIAIVHELSETYENAKTLLDMLDIESISYAISSDLKLINILLGLQGHNSMFCCCYCEARNPRWNREEGVGKWQKDANLRQGLLNRWTSHWAV